jgi:hypothetical protein
MWWASIAALDLAAREVGGESWSGDPDQQAWIDEYRVARGKLDRFSDDELVRTWAPTAEEINKFLADQGFPGVQLTPWSPSPYTFGVAAVQKVVAQWRVPGKSATIEYQGKDYPGVNLSGQAGPFFRQVKGHRDPLVVIPTKGEDSVILTKSEHLGGTELLKRAKEIAAAATNPNAAWLDFGGVVFPQINLDEKPDVNWMSGLSTINDRTDEPWVLAQAVQQNRLFLDTVGARVESAFAGGLRCTSRPQRKPVYTLDEPFIAVVVREGCELPIVAAWLTTDTWKSPPSS